MNSREISLWVDSRWCDALESTTGKTMDELMQGQMDTLILTLPQDVQDRIKKEIRQEDKQQAEERERSRRFSVTRVTEFKETRICLAESGETPFQVALRLRRYLRGEDGGRGLCSNGAPLTEAEMERYVAEAVSGSPSVVGVYDIDLDAGKFSMLDAKDGWETHRVRDVSTAVYYAAKKVSADWITKRDNFRERLDRLELLSPQRPVFIRGAEPLPVDKVRFWDEISQIDNCLNFYVPVVFDPDSVFGTHVATEENDDWLNLYANYDMERGCVCDTLEVYLVRGDGTELDCQYRLSPEERAALLPKMDAYCKEQMGLSLEEARAQYLSETEAGTQAEIPTSALISQVETIRTESHESVDAKCDALIRKAILGSKGTEARLIPLRSDLSCLKGEKPSAVILPSKEIIPVKNWRQAVGTIMRDCASDPERKARLMEMSGKIIGNFRTILGHRADSMNVPIEICEGLYMEGKFDTGALLHVLTDKILPNTGYDYRSVLFQLREPKMEQEHAPHEAEAPQVPPTQSGPMMQM